MEQRCGLSSFINGLTTTQELHFEVNVRVELRFYILTHPFRLDASFLWAEAETNTYIHVCFCVYSISS